MIELKQIPVSKIFVADRRREDYGDLPGLAENIKMNGLIQPIAVYMRNPKDAEADEKPYGLAAGERRLRACRILHMNEIAARIYPEHLTEYVRKHIELDENYFRKNLTYAEEVMLKKDLHDMEVAEHGVKYSTAKDAPGHSLRDTAKMLGESPANISRDLALAKLLEDHPELKGMKNKTQLQKLIKRAGKEEIAEELNRRLQKKMSATPIEKQHELLCDMYKVGNFFDEIKKYPDESFDIIECDPPYAIALQQVKTEFNAQYNPESYNEIAEEYYPAFIELIMENCYRVMKPHSWMLWWFASDPWWPIIVNEIRKEQYKGITFRAQPLIWAKPQGQTNQPDIYLPSCYEMCFAFCKGKPGIARQGRNNWFDYRLISPDNKIHPTERPVELIQDMLSTFAWQTAKVCTPFAGSGNTLLAAANLGMEAVGWDLTDAYKKLYHVRVWDAKPGDYKSYKEV